MDFFIFGLQRSGTNFLKVLLETNFACKQVNHERRDTWKHSLEIPAGVEDKNLLLIYKNPYKWIESLALRNTVDWLITQKKYPADAREGVDPAMLIGERKLNVINFAKTYREFHDNWLFKRQIPLSKLLVLKYEDLLSDHGAILQRVENSWNAKKRHPIWRLPAKGSISQSRDYDENREIYYLSDELQEITEEQLIEINKILDASFMNKLGYQQRFSPRT